MRSDAGVLWQSRGSGMSWCKKNLNGCVPQVPQSCQVAFAAPGGRARAPLWLEQVQGCAAARRMCRVLERCSDFWTCSSPVLGGMCRTGIGA